NDLQDGQRRWGNMALAAVPLIKERGRRGPAAGLQFAVPNFGLLIRWQVCQVKRGIETQRRERRCDEVADCCEIVGVQRCADAKKSVSECNAVGGQITAQAVQLRT